MDFSDQAPVVTVGIKDKVGNFVKKVKARGPRLAGRRQIRVVARARTDAGSTAKIRSTGSAKSGGGRSGMDVVAGGAARAAAQATIHPLDTIKVRMQAPNAKPLSEKARKLAQQSL